MGEQQTGPEGATEARCTACGAVPSPAEPPASATAEAADTAAETHCEWCGAEYPVPGAA